MRVIPQHLIGRVMSVFNLIQQIANIGSTAAAGLLVGSVLRNLHGHIAGMAFGPVNTIFGISGLLIVAAGLVIAFQLHQLEDEVERKPQPAR